MLAVHYSPLRTVITSLWWHIHWDPVKTYICVGMHTHTCTHRRMYIYLLCHVCIHLCICISCHTVHMHTHIHIATGTFSMLLLPESHSLKGEIMNNRWTPNRSEIKISRQDSIMEAKTGFLRTNKKSGSLHCRLTAVLGHITIVLGNHSGRWRKRRHSP